MYYYIKELNCIFLLSLILYEIFKFNYKLKENIPYRLQLYKLSLFYNI